MKFTLTIFDVSLPEAKALVDWCEQVTAVGSKEDEFADTRIESLGLSARAMNALRYQSDPPLRTVGDLVRHGPRHVSMIRNAGRVTVEEIRKALGDLGIEWT